MRLRKMYIWYIDGEPACDAVNQVNVLKLHKPHAMNKQVGKFIRMKYASTTC